MRLTLSTLALALSACAARPTPPPASPPFSQAPQRRVRLAAPTSEAPGIVRSLADTVGPRLAGSPGEARAEAWAVRTMNDLGFTNVHTEPVRVPHWERGESVGELTAPIRRPMAVAALGGSVGTPTEGIEAEVVEVPSLAALAALPDADVHGKIVYVHHVMRRTDTGMGYGESVGVRWRAAAAAGRKGAVAVLIRSVGTDATRAPHTGQMDYGADTPRIPAASLSTADGDSLHRLLSAEGRSAPVRFRLTLGCRALPEADGANVIGEVTGSEHPEQIVLVGAHLDAWDLGTGALDDGAGVAIVLAAAHGVMQARPPRRTVRVVLFANEENGGAGARAYAEQHRDELAHHIVAMEADAGDGRVLAARFRGEPASEVAFARAVALVRPYGVRLRREEAHGGEDLQPLAPAGVPRVDLAQDMSRYFDYHHTANDTPAVLDADSLDQAVAVWTAVVGEFASMDEDLGRAAGGAP